MGIFDWKHWLILLLVVVLVFGAKRFRHVGSDLAEAIKGFRRSVKPTPATTVEPVQPALLKDQSADNRKV